MLRFLCLFQLLCASKEVPGAGMDILAPLGHNLLGVANRQGHEKRWPGKTVRFFWCKYQDHVRLYVNSHTSLILNQLTVYKNTDSA